MKYQLELIINRPRVDVWRIFDDPNNMDKWQPSLMQIERLEGMAGQPGSVASLHFKSGEREYFLIEKVTYREEPTRLDGLYENEFAINTIKNTFLEKDVNETLWKTEVEFRFKTLAMRLVGPFAKKRLAANTQKEMDRFKALVESM